MNDAALTALREIATKSTRYPYTLKFTREFTRGNLAGLTHEDTLGFCAKGDAEEWVSDINRAEAHGKLDYLVTMWAVERA